MYDKIIKDTENDMKKACESFEIRISKIRAGRANDSILDGLTFSYYGSQTPINQAATISTPEPRLLVIKPWDKSNIKEIEKAINKSDIGINPQNDGEVIRLPFPALTEERRKDLTKQVNEYSEDSKIQIRNIRRDALDTAKKAEKSADLTEDDLFSIEEDIQKITKKYIDNIEKIADSKNKELLEV
ncbi:MAG: ribosome recycling factor [Anaerococcus hydrogenalis]|nr:ribosome recycling factor [Anaerococcus hydrogenalis]